jgi:glucose/arabinose dehydrogenase
MKKNLGIILGAIVLLIVLWVGNWAWKNFRGAGPTIRDGNGNIVDQLPDSNDPNLPEAQNNTNFPLKLPKGFAISVFAKNLPGARAIVIDGLNNMWVSQTGEGNVSQVEAGSGRVNEIFRGLDRPHGLAVDPGQGTMLYIAEETKISRVALYSEDTLHKIADLPAGGRHFTRTLAFGPDGRLYVSIGSTCDVCHEKDERISTIYSMKEDGSDMKKVASGLRNAVFFDWSYVDGRMWATEMGRDMLGDDLPPDEINIITGPSTGSGQNPPDFGWPICYGKNVHDINFDKNQYIRDPCADKAASYIDLPAHSAPLGLAFVPEEGWPEDYWYDLIVAFHGSWNRSEPTGYKLTRIKLNAQGNYEGTDSTGSPQVEDFVSGWLSSDGETSLGRPVDIIIQPGGTMFISDDKAGVIYKIQYLGNALSSTNDMVRVESPKENSVVASPLKITGQARGNWYFEASFPLEIVDANWKVLGQSYAQAKGEWMTTDFVAFESNLTFEAPTTDTGWLVLKKDNPSGLPENDAEMHYPIKFK